MVSREMVGEGIMVMRSTIGVLRYKLQATRIGDKWWAPEHRPWWPGGSFSRADGIVRAVEQAILRHQEKLSGVDNR